MLWVTWLGRWIFPPWNIEYRGLGGVKVCERALCISLSLFIYSLLIFLSFACLLLSFIFLPSFFSSCLHHSFVYSCIALPLLHPLFTPSLPSYILFSFAPFSVLFCSSLLPSISSSCPLFSSLIHFLYSLIPLPPLFLPFHCILLWTLVICSCCSAFDTDTLPPCGGAAL